MLMMPVNPFLSAVVMGRTKKFVDKKRAVTFAVVHRSQRDPLINDPDATPYVLKELDAPNVKYRHKKAGETRRVALSDLDLPEEVFSDEEDWGAPQYLKESRDGGPVDGNDDRVDLSGDKDADDFEDGDEDDDIDSLERDEKETTGKGSTVDDASASRPSFPDFVYRRSDFEMGHLGLPSDGYDYAKHMREITGEGLFLPKVEAPVSTREEVNDEAKRLFGSRYENAYLEGVSLPGTGLARALELDPEIIAVLDRAANEDVEFDNDLPDNFMELANASGDDDEYDSNFECEDDIDYASDAAYESGSDDAKHVSDVTKKQLAMSSSRSTHSVCSKKERELEDKYERYTNMTGTTVRRQRGEAGQVLEEQFERLMTAEYEDHDDVGSLDDDDPEMKGTAKVEDMDHLLDEFLEQQVLNTAAMIPSDRTCVDDEYRELILKKAAIIDNSKPEYEKKKIIVDETAGWDCETIVTTYTNTENHLGIIAAPVGRARNKTRGMGTNAMVATQVPDVAAMASDIGPVFGGASVAGVKQIKISKKTGVAIGYLPGDKSVENTENVEGSSAESNDEDGEGIVQIGIHTRQRGESKEARKARKDAVKEERRLRRQQKKAIKEEFKVEELRQVKLQAVPGTNLSIRKIN